MFWQKTLVILKRSWNRETLNQTFRHRNLWIGIRSIAISFRQSLFTFPFWSTSPKHKTFRWNTAEEQRLCKSAGILIVRTNLLRGIHFGKLLWVLISVVAQIRWAAMMSVVRIFWRENFSIAEKCCRLIIPRNCVKCSIFPPVLFLFLLLFETSWREKNIHKVFLFFFFFFSMQNQQ